jgi:hypothetical protein
MTLIACAAAEETPTGSIAVKGETVFEDNFERKELGDKWRISHPSFAIVDGVMVGNQTRPTHGAVAEVKLGRKDVVIEFNFQLNDSTGINAVLDDDDFKEGHAGHICRVSLRPQGIFLGDDKERLRHDTEEMKKDPAKKAEVEKLTAGRSLSVPTKLEADRWYRCRMEIAGDELCVRLDDKPLACLKSSGVDHPQKSTFHFTVSGEGAKFDDFTIWSATRAN